MIREASVNDIDDDAGSFDYEQHTSEPIPDHVPDPTTDPTAEPTVEPTVEPNPTKRAKTSKSSSVNVDDLALDMRKALQYLIKGKDGPTVRECTEKLELVGLDPIDPLFIAAYHSFGQSSDMREAWMALPAIPEVMRAWITVTAKSLGLI